MSTSKRHMDEIIGNEINDVIVNLLNFSVFLNFIAYFIAYSSAIGYGLGTTAQTYTAINNLATQFDSYVKGNNTSTDTDSNSAQSGTVFGMIFAVSLSAAICKGFFYFLNTAETNKIALVSASDTNKSTALTEEIQLQNFVSADEGNISVDLPEEQMAEERYLLTAQSTKSQDRNCQSYFKMSAQLWGSLVGIGLPNGGSMLLQTLRWGVPLPYALVIASLTTVTNFISIGTIFKFGSRKSSEKQELIAEQIDQFMANQTHENSDERSTTAKIILAKFLAYFCAGGYGAGTGIQAFTLNEKLINDLFLLLNSNDTDTSPSTIWFYSFLFLNITASLCKGESYFYNSVTTNEFFANDLLGIRESNAERPVIDSAPSQPSFSEPRAQRPIRNFVLNQSGLSELDAEILATDLVPSQLGIHESSAERLATDLTLSRFRGYFATARQFWGAIGATAVPNSGAIGEQAANVGLSPLVAGIMSGLTLFTTGVSVKNSFKYGTRPRETTQQQANISAVSMSNRGGG